MKRAILLLLVCAIPLFADEKRPADLPAETRAAIDAIKVGMEEWKVVELLRPVSLEFGRVTYGGSGAGHGYFRISETQQIWVAFEGIPGRASKIGHPEPLETWKPVYHPAYYTRPPEIPPAQITLLRIDRLIEESIGSWKHAGPSAFFFRLPEKKSK